MRSCAPSPPNARVLLGAALGRERSAGIAVPALLAAVLCASAARADRPSVRLPDAGRVVFAGQRITVVWDGLDEDVDEMELLLSVDGGRRFPVRLTRSLRPSSPEYEWTVPALPAAAARIGLRCGRGGREDEGTPSEPFAIEVPPTALPSALQRVEGEWWIVPAAGPRPAGIRPVRGARPADDVSALEADVHDDEKACVGSQTAGREPRAGETLPGTPTLHRRSFTPAPEAPKRE